MTRAAGAACVFAVAACARGSGGAVPIGDRFPMAAPDGSSPRTRVVWVLRPDDYLTCQTAANGVRRLQRRYGAALPVAVISVGPHPEWLRGFLGRQRIDAPVTRLDEDEFRRRFGREPAPWLYLVRDGRVFDVVPGRGEVYPAARWSMVIDSMERAGGAGHSLTQLDSRKPP